MKPFTALVLSLLAIAVLRPAPAQDDPGLGPSIDAMTIDPVPPVFAQEYEPPYPPFSPVPFPYHRRPHTINFANPFLLTGKNPFSGQVNSTDQADSDDQGDLSDQTDSADQVSSGYQGTETQPAESFSFPSQRKRHRYHPAMRRAIEASRREAKEADAIITGAKKSNAKKAEPQKADADGTPADTTQKKESDPRPTDEKP